MENGRRERGLGEERNPPREGWMGEDVSLGGEV